MVQSKELAKIGYIKVLDKNKNEVFVDPKELIINNKSLEQCFLDIVEKLNKVLDSNKKIQSDNEKLKSEIDDKNKIIKELQQKINDVTLFAEER